MRVVYLKGPLELDVEPDRTIPVSRSHCGDAVYRRFPGANLGDWFVIRATVEAIDAEAAYTISPKSDQAAFDLVNAECDVLVLKGGNFIYPGFLKRHIGLETLRKIRIPIVYIGSGVQMPLGATELTLEKEDVECLRYIHASSTSCMVRGTTTAEMLARLGITNVRVCGCPTIFWSRRPAIRVRPVGRERVAWTMRQNLFSPDAAVHRAQFQAIRRLRDTCGSLTIALQGEETTLQRYHAFQHWGARSTREREQLAGGVVRTRERAIARNELEELLAQEYAATTDPGLLDWVMRHLYYSLDIAAYAEWLASRDFVAGCRLHGNMLALAQGVPVYYFTYDARTQEMVDLLKIPGRALSEQDIEVPWDALDYAPFERRYAALFGEYKAFLEENHIAHRLS